MVAAIAAMLVKNSPLSGVYDAFLNVEGEVRIGAFSLQKPLFLWVNDFLMAIFFLLIGLEVKRELIYGHLSERSRIVLPAAGAVGGVVVPAGVYVALNWQDPVALKGWAVPTATDIAFALGVLALVGSRLPSGLKVFLMTLAILDDLIAIIVIAMFYTSGLSVVSLAAGSVFVVALVALNRANVLSIAPYMLVGLGLWVCVLKSGVHATLAGVLCGLLVPAHSRRREREAPLEHLIEILHPWAAFAILPLFAFVNAGVSLSGVRVEDLLDSVPAGIFFGLVVGKPIGVFAFAACAVLLGRAALPEKSSWLQLLGVAVLCGVGFTMSLFIGGLAFAEGGPGYGGIDRLGVLVGSLAAALVGFGILRLSLGDD
jgi:NhaA family Na+:H+ antiporter